MNDNDSKAASGTWHYAPEIHTKEGARIEKLEEELTQAKRVIEMLAEALEESEAKAKYLIQGVVV